ncbi:hypothetical protein SSYIS1_08580 [Serratia symbiotica]|uniref:Uncharacterized protein n=1 Tax=Serratia symbiotica TaxID=138074 RepID=A0A455VNN3_9GAMM|nr:hypothetical protein SSYIS1_08580 [Serratia symbiotica]
MRVVGEQDTPSALLTHKSAHEIKKAIIVRIVIAFNAKGKGIGNQLLLW